MSIGSDDPRPSTRDAISARVRSLALEAGARPSDHGFGLMFPALAAATHRLPEGPQTLKDLAALAAAVAATAEDEEAPPAQARSPRVRAPGDSDIPAAYTFLLDFVRNDLVWERRPAALQPGGAAAFAPLGSLEGLSNRRSGCLDLESVYDAPRDPASVRRMLVGALAPDPLGRALPRPSRALARGDLPRHPRHADPGRDRIARMSDPRNDAVLPLGQLTLAFLKAHNALVAAGLSFEAARRALRRRYQWMVLHDLLPRLVAPQVMAQMREDGPRAWRVARAADLFMPVEFWAAAFVLAPSMARPSYAYNAALPDVEPAVLATRLALGAGAGAADAVPETFAIAWEGFLPLEAEAPQRARRIDTRLAGAAETVAATAAHHLLAGFRLGLPTGQAVARHLGLVPLADDRLLAGLPDAQRVAALPFCSATPLWFYILAEAGDPEGPDGVHLGPVGSHIVAEALWTLARHSDASIQAPGTVQDFDRFTLCDLILLAAEDVG